MINQSSEEFYKFLEIFQQLHGCVRQPTEDEFNLFLAISDLKDDADYQDGYQAGYDDGHRAGYTECEYDNDLG